MLRNSIRVVTMGTLLAIGIAWQGARANLITDGSFENPTTPVPDASFNQYHGGDSIDGSWNVVGNDTLLIISDYLEPAQGITGFNAEDLNNSLDLSGAGNTGPTDGVTQNIATIANASYSISFWVGAAKSDNGNSVYQNDAVDDLSINGGPRVSYKSAPGKPGVINWTQYIVDFQATGSTTSITFFNGTPSGTNEAGLDNVDVEEVPVPLAAKSGLALLGLLSLVVLRKSTRSTTTY